MKCKTHKIIGCIWCNKKNLKILNLDYVSKLKEVIEDLLDLTKTYNIGQNSQIVERAKAILKIVN